MMFDLQDLNGAVKLTCHGDELGLCYKCKLRFHCYTGFVDFRSHYSLEEYDGTYSGTLSSACFDTKEYGEYGDLFSISY